jgi:hypothetical protein
MYYGHQLQKYCVRVETASHDARRVVVRKCPLHEINATQYHAEMLRRVAQSTDYQSTPPQQHCVTIETKALPFETFIKLNRMQDILKPNMSIGFAKESYIKLPTAKDFKLTFQIFIH